MADDVADPREGPNHPRRRADLVGHAEAEARLLRSYASGRMHHAWLLAGPRGIGKATLAYRLARYILRHPDPASARSSLYVAPEDPVARRVAASAHPDLLVIQRPFDPKAKRAVKSEINVQEAREAGSFFAHTAAEGGWRICIVDAADDLNRNAENALLKVLEEPPARALFLLVSHQPGVLLETIRSRCMRLDFGPLSYEESLMVLDGLGTGAAREELEHAARLSGGSPGRALDLLGSQGAAAFASFAELASRPGALDIGARILLADRFAPREAADDFDVFCELLVDWAAAQARAAALIGRGGRLAEVHDDISHSIRLANRLNLDRRQTAFEALTAISEALK